MPLHPPFHPFEGRVQDPSSENIQKAKEGKLKVHLPWLAHRKKKLDPDCHPLTGSSEHYCLCDVFHQNNSKDERDVLRTIGLVPELAGKINSQCAEQLFSEVKRNITSWICKTICTRISCSKTSFTTGTSHGTGRSWISSRNCSVAIIMCNWIPMERPYLVMFKYSINVWVDHSILLIVLTISLKHMHRSRTKCGTTFFRDNPNFEYNSERERNAYRLKLFFNSLKFVWFLLKFKWFVYLLLVYSHPVAVWS